MEVWRSKGRLAKLQMMTVINFNVVTGPCQDLPGTFPGPSQGLPRAFPVPSREAPERLLRGPERLPKKSRDRLQTREAPGSGGEPPYAMKAVARTVHSFGAEIVFILSKCGEVMQKKTETWHLEFISIFCCFHAHGQYGHEEQRARAKNKSW